MFITPSSHGIALQPLYTRMFINHKSKNSGKINVCHISNFISVSRVQACNHN